MRETYSTTILPRRGERPNSSAMSKDGRPLPAIASKTFDEHLAKRHLDLAEIGYEFSECLKTLEALASSPPPNEAVARALTSHFIITYARPFGDSKGRGVKAEGNSSWIPSGEEGLKLHRELIQLRNKLIAHTDDSEYRDRGSWVYVDQVQRPSIVFGIGFTRAAFSVFYETQIPRFQMHVLGALKLLKEKQTEVEDLLLARANSQLADKDAQ